MGDHQHNTLAFTDSGHFDFESTPDGVFGGSSHMDLGRSWDVQPQDRTEHQPLLVPSEDWGSFHNWKLAKTHARPRNHVPFDLSSSALQGQDSVRLSVTQDVELDWDPLRSTEEEETAQELDSLRSTDEKGPWQGWSPVQSRVRPRIRRDPALIMGSLWAHDFFELIPKRNNPLSWTCQITEEGGCRSILPPDQRLSLLPCTIPANEITRL